ncbi:MAG: phosphoglucosamine mutase [bacterium]|nr:phosphoglucosamine mutase [bacterium]
MSKLFGTDGIRGIANQYPMTPQFAVQLGIAAANKLTGQDKLRIVVGKDTRLSSDMLEAALTAGITSAGGDVLKVGVLPTPGIAYFTKSLSVDAGIVISASHNPFDNNGIKFFGPNGLKLNDKIEEEIEASLADTCFAKDCLAEGIGKVIEVSDARTQYFNFVKKTCFAPLNLRGEKIVIDCANGATSFIAPSLFEELGAEVILVNCSPNGININLNCGSLHPEQTAEVVKTQKAMLGFCFDGDGDRVIALDEAGHVVDGDFIMAICAKYFKENALLNNNLVVTTVMSNIGFYLALKTLNIDVITTRVGDRYVVEQMLEKGAVLGGEQSGHIIFSNHSNTGDGLITALQLLAIMQKTSTMSLSQLAQVMRKYPQILINVRVRDTKTNLETLPELQSAIKASEEILKDEGRILVRYSGTEPLCRVMVEGPTEEVINQIAKNLVFFVEKELGEK